MSRKSRHNADIRARILDGAGRLFRAHGFDGVGINALMAEAGLTRGAFYAHFKSKEALFLATLQTDHPLVQMLRDRGEAEPDVLWQRMRDSFRLYLNPRHLDAFHRNCNLATLTADVQHGPDAAKAAYADTLRAIRTEMVRGQAIPQDDPDIIAALTLAIGAVAMAAALADPAAQTATLTAARDGFETMIDAARSQTVPAHEHG